MQAVRRVIDRINQETLRQVYRGTGSKAYRPELMLAIALYMILQGLRSPARWAENAKTKDQCKLLGHGIEPSRTVFYDFRDRAAKFIESVHDEIIALAITNQVIEPTDGCLDGTFVAASASRHKMFNLKQISRRLGILKRAISKLDNPHQVSSNQPLAKCPGWLATTSSGRREQLERFRRAKARILQEIRDNRNLPKSLRRDEARMALSPADIDAVIGKDKFKVTRPLYNIQYMCDFRSDVILSYGVYRKKNDTGTLLPMIEKTQSVTGGLLKRVHADSGYCSLLELEDSQQAGVELFAPVAIKKGSKGRPTESGLPQITADEFVWNSSANLLSCPVGHSMRQVSRSRDPRADNRYVIELRFEQSEQRCGECELAGQCLASGSKRRTIRRLEKQSLLDAQGLKMDSDEGRASGRQRKIQVERRYGDSKQHRGGSHLHGRGLTRTTGETGLMVVAQNCLTLYNLEKHTANDSN